MKREDLFEAIGDLDEALLDENVTELPKRRNFGWIAAVAACLVLVGGAIAVPLMLSSGEKLPASSSAEQESGAEGSRHDIAEETDPFSGLTAEDVDEVYFEIESMCTVVLRDFEIQQFLDRVQASRFSYVSDEPFPDNGYIQWVVNMNDGTGVKLSLDRDSDHAHINDARYEVDTSIELLIKYGEYLMTQQHSGADPSELAALTAEDITNVNVNHWAMDRSVDLTAEQIDEFLQYVAKIELTGRREDMMIGDDLSFEITCKDFVIELSDTLYEIENYEPLYNFGMTVLELREPEKPTPIGISPASEEWLGRVYFGSEFPYFIYGNDDYCVFSEGMDGLFIFDFNKGEITFSANITETFDNAGIAHGVEGWNGVGLSAYKENGEVKLLCTASSGGDGTGIRGFTVDVENGTLTEIQNFALKDLDIIQYVYNVPADGLPYLFGAAPIPLEDGYICFENSGLNNEILPGEGSHLPMIMIRKVKGDVVEEWIPFKDVVPTTRCGLDSAVTEQNGH